MTNEGFILRVIWISVVMFLFLQMEFAFRLLSSDENIERGLRAKNPNANVEVVDHIADGSKWGFRSQYISVTSTYSGVRTFAQRKRDNDIKIVEINLADLRKEEVQIIDTRTILQECQEADNQMAYNFANKFDEMLIVGVIPSKCLEVAFDGRKEDLPLWM